MSASHAHLGRVADKLGLDAPERHALWAARLAEDQPAVDQLYGPEGSSRTVRPPEAHACADETGSDIGLPTVHPVAGSATQCVRAAVQRCADKDVRDLNAIVHVFAAEALSASEELDERISTNCAIGPLAGRLIAVKDMVNIRGHVATAGTRVLAGHAPATEDAPVVARLRAADAILLASTSMHTLAYGAIGANDAGPVHNPNSPGAMTGGSSSGSAAAVAAGLVDIALGTDTGGSIRIPAALCAVVGLKPTFGSLPVDGVLPLGPSLDHVGPIGRTVDDVARAFAVLSGRSARMTPSISDLTGVTVGVLRGYFYDHLDLAVRHALDGAIHVIRQLGGSVHDVEIPTAYRTPGAMLCTLGPEALHSHLDLLRDHRKELPEDVRLRLELGMFRTGEKYIRAQHVRDRLRIEMDCAMDEADLLLTATVPVPAPRLDARTVQVPGATWRVGQALPRLTAPFNLTGYPALSLPWAHDERGGGIGIQLAARPHQEDKILAAAALLEATDPDTRLAPSLHNLRGAGRALPLQREGFSEV
ncbi:amidase [Nocardia rhamnosiphila]|uniref:Amidase n=1 Tax=Nocardia rhamnosiphila TaxID=426716 RepID=A0ABV2WRM8_9NOCA